MNTITSSMTGQMAMDGHAFYNAVSVNSGSTKTSKIPDTGTLPNSAAEVTENLHESLAETEANVSELQRLSDMVQGHKLQFNVNNDSGKVIVKVVDPSTDEIIREIPSEDLQRIQARMKQAIGLLFDEMI